LASTDAGGIVLPPAGCTVFTGFMRAMRFWANFAWIMRRAASLLVFHIGFSSGAGLLWPGPGLLGGS
jgi:hypothetical protein